MGEFILKLEPNEKIVYAGKKLGEEPVQVLLKVTNPTKERQICKVKCTSNEMFRIRPPVFALKSEEEITVKLTFNAGKTVPDSGRHYFAVYYIKGNDGTKPPRACWKEHKGDADGTRRLFVDFKKEGDAEKEAEEKKEAEKDKNEKKDGGEKKDEEKKEQNKEDKKEEKEEEKKEGDDKDGEKDEAEKKEDAEKKVDDNKEEKASKKEEKNDEKKEDEKKEEQKNEGDKKDEKKEGEKEEEKKDDDNKEDEKK
uniref:Major sperm protein n=1 Tax=Ascaris lumbricoides TaxID=6252 RepID=A0A0M3HRR2_ASCLU